MVILENRKYAQIKFYCGAELFKASYISKQLCNALYAAFESCVHGALKVATPTVLGVRARGILNQPHRRCLPLTGSVGNATMLTPTVRENLLFPSSSPSARWPGRFQQVQSGWRTQPTTHQALVSRSAITYVYTKDEGVKVAYSAKRLTHIQRERILMYANYIHQNSLPTL